MMSHNESDSEEIKIIKTNKKRQIKNKIIEIMSSDDEEKQYIIDEYGNMDDKINEGSNNVKKVENFDSENNKLSENEMSIEDEKYDNDRLREINSYNEFDNLKDININDYNNLKESEEIFSSDNEFFSNDNSSNKSKRTKCNNDIFEDMNYVIESNINTNENNLNNTTTNINENKTKIILRRLKENYTFFLSPTDTLETIKKLKYKGTPVSKYLTLTELGFTTDHIFFDVMEEGILKLNLKINIDSQTTENINIDRNKTIRDLICMYGKRQVVFNGYVVCEDVVVKEVFEDGDVVDVI